MNTPTNSEALPPTPGSPSFETCRELRCVIDDLKEQLREKERWIDAETKPRTGQKVIVCGIYKSGHRWRAMARWQPAGTIDASFWEDYPESWESDDGDTITNPEDLWLEESVELEQTGFLVDVTHWKALPELPPHPFTAPPESLPENS